MRWQTQYVAVSRFQRQLAGQKLTKRPAPTSIRTSLIFPDNLFVFFGVCFQEPPSFSSWNNQPIHRRNTTQSLSRTNQIYENVQRHRMVEEHNEATCISDAEEVADHAKQFRKKSRWCFCGRGREDTWYRICAHKPNYL